jgi:hypothetical protein
MHAVLREIDTAGKSKTCMAYDIILKPLNIVLGSRKIVQVSPHTWKKETRSEHLILFVISFVAAVIFAPVVLPTLLLKSRNNEHKWRFIQYQVDKQQAYFEEQGYTIQGITRDDHSFTFSLQSETSATLVIAKCSWLGKFISLNLKASA